ncbi:NUDIX hydrolase [Proteiniphilum sp.]|nr:NUDIX hydrolase [Proteiniphilum sp.]MEA4917936.1 NUDIX hydrolase [Proteiniphilum sp.]
MNHNNDDMHWIVIESEYLHRRPWLTVRKETLEMPNGKVVPEYYVLEYPNWVNIIAITNEGKYIMVEQYRPGIRRTCMELCAGVCEGKDESPLASAQRELMEETGYGGGSWSEFMCVAPNASAANNYSYCFIAENVEKLGNQSLDESEELTVHLLSFEEMKELLKSGEVIQATMAAPLWKYIALRDK